MRVGHHVGMGKVTVPEVSVRAMKECVDVEVHPPHVSSAEPTRNTLEPLCLIN